MTQTLHQRPAIRAYNNVVALRPPSTQRMPDAWRHPDPEPQSTAADQRAERWWRIHDERMDFVWGFALAVVLVADIYIIVGVLTGGAA